MDVCEERMKCGGDGVEGGAPLMNRQEGWPPTGAKSDVAKREVGSGRNGDEQEYGTGPAEANLDGIVADDAGFADVGREGGPVAVIVKHLAGGVICLEEALGPVALVQAESACVPAHDSLIEDATGQQAKALLLQGDEMPLADFSDCGNLLQRNAAG